MAYPHHTHVHHEHKDTENSSLKLVEKTVIHDEKIQHDEYYYY